MRFFCRELGSKNHYIIFNIHRNVMKYWFLCLNIKDKGWNVINIASTTTLINFFHSSVFRPREGPEPRECSFAYFVLNNYRPTFSFQIHYELIFLAC